MPRPHILPIHRCAAAAALLLSLSAPAAARGSAYVADCSASLTDRWRQAEASHPIDRSVHIPIVLINVPLGSQRRYERASTALTRAFPSFREAIASRILLGCCAMPVWGSISFDDLDRLSAANFVPLCAVARRNGSTAASVRIDPRATYGKGEDVEAYFFVFWMKKPTARPVPNDPRTKVS
jgi:hypothetical protein